MKKLVVVTFVSMFTLVLVVGVYGLILNHQGARGLETCVDELNRQLRVLQPHDTFGQSKALERYDLCEKKPTETLFSSFEVDLLSRKIAVGMQMFILVSMFVIIIYALKKKQRANRY